MNNVKKTLALMLAMIMVLTSTAFANWDSFQGSNDNNGTTDVDVTTFSGTPTTVTLPNTNASTGLDVEPLVHGDRIYAFYNGGSEGAKLAAVSAVDGKVLWDVVVGAQANNISQIATPVITEDGKTLYGTTTYTADIFKGITPTVTVKPANGEAKATDAAKVSIPDGATLTATYSDVNLPGTYGNLQVSTGLTAETGKFNGTVTVMQGEAKVQEFSGESYGTYAYSIYYSDGAPIQKGTYTVTVEITNNTGKAVDWTANQLLINYWQLFRVTGIDGNSPKVEALTKDASSETEQYYGYGQASTPLTLSGNYVYFGIYDGDRAYVQYNTSNGTIARFDPPGDDQFYWAGAVVVDGHVYFGSEQGVVYACSEDMFTKQIGNMYVTGGAHIRSTMVYKEHKFAGLDMGKYLYFTSQDGKLWRVKIEGNSVIMPEYASLGKNVASVSTPTVVSKGDDSYIYVSYYDPSYGPNNGIKMVKANGLSVVSDVCTVDGMVQSSPVVYTKDGSDYIYFTTNTWNGTGYYCKYDGTSTTSAESVSDTSAYCLQGFAMGQYSTGSGPLTRTVRFAVFGNDNGQLVIVK